MNAANHYATPPTSVQYSAGSIYCSLLITVAPTARKYLQLVSFCNWRRYSNSYSTTYPDKSGSTVIGIVLYEWGGSVGEWLACLTQAQKARVQIAAATLSGNSLRQTVHTHRASAHQPAKLVAALLRVARVTAGLAECNGSLLPGL